MTISRWVGLVALGVAGCQSSGPLPSELSPVTPSSAVPTAATAVPPAASRHAVEVLATFPHQADAFTEGLVWNEGSLYESVGLTGKSDLRRVSLDTGATVAVVALPGNEFGEGLALVDDRLIQLTWKSGVGHVYDRATLASLDTFEYAGEGWGLTYDGRRLIMSDGTAELRFLDPTNYAELGRLTITDQGEPVVRLNELEYVDGYVYANVWLTADIVVIDPSTGRVVMRLDTSALRPATTLNDRDAVANGIAYDPVDDRLFLTGKRWTTLYEVHRPEVGPATAPS